MYVFPCENFFSRKGFASRFLVCISPKHLTRSKKRSTDDFVDRSPLPSSFLDNHVEESSVSVAGTERDKERGLVGPARCR